MAVLRESPWYQEILEKGLQQGIQQAVEQGIQQGRVQELLSSIALFLEAIATIPFCSRLTVRDSREIYA